ncbi:MAG: polyhydroxyalkanoic acid system family protein [Myxococcota bacterium]
MQRIALIAFLAASAAWADTPSEAGPRTEPAKAPAAPAPAETTPDPFSISGSTITLEVAHSFPRASARERVGYLLEYWRERFGVAAEWRGDHVFLTGRVFGMEIRARFDVTDTAVTGVAADPGWFWRGKAQSYVTRKLRKYLHPDYADP